LPKIGRYRDLLPWGIEARWLTSDALEDVRTLLTDYQAPNFAEKTMQCPICLNEKRVVVTTQREARRFTVDVPCKTCKKASRY
jgi:hypothetical protein